MMRLIRYEFIKLFCKKSVLALILLLSAVNFFKIAGEYQSYSWLAEGTGSKSWHSAYWNLYEEYSGEITAEKIKALLAVYQPLEEATADMTASTATDDPDTMTGNLYSDRNLLKKYYVDPMRYFYGYRAASLQAAEKAKENALRSQALGQTYEARKNSVIYRLYSERSIPAYAYREMYNYYLNYDFSTVLILLLCLYGICGAFASEKETQMDLLLVTSPNGGRKTAMAKILAVSAFSLFGFRVVFAGGLCWIFPRLPDDGGLEPPGLRHRKLCGKCVELQSAPVFPCVGAFAGGRGMAVRYAHAAFVDVLEKRIAPLCAEPGRMRPAGDKRGGLRLLQQSMGKDGHALFVAYKPRAAWENGIFEHSRPSGSRLSRFALLCSGRRIFDGGSHLFPHEAKQALHKEGS